jgi:DNA-binding NarL/FixJ family response regulator
MAGVRVLIADDHPVACDGLRAMLTSTGAAEVAAEAATGQQAVRETTLHHPDVVVMDLAMPRLNGMRRPARPYPPTRWLGAGADHAPRR